MLSDLFYADEHTSCLNYKVSFDSGFRYMSFDVKHEIRSELSSYNNLIMQVGGVSMISCDHSPMRELRGGEMILIPKSAYFEMFIQEGSQIVFFGFDAPQSNCDKVHFDSYAPICKQMLYDFEPTKIKESLSKYLDLLIYYLRNGVNCTHLHESKHKELFLCLRCFYTKEEIAYLLHPIIGGFIDFRNVILQNSDKFSCVGDMINVTNMSRTQFYLKFSNEFGVTAKQWLLKRRIQKIKYAASRPNISVKELMNECDFDSFVGLNQFCKLHFGMTPSDIIDSMKMVES